MNYCRQKTTNQALRHRINAVNFIDILKVIKKNNGFVIEKTKDEKLRDKFKDYFRFLDTAFHTDNIKTIRLKKKKDKEKTKQLKVPFVMGFQELTSLMLPSNIVFNLMFLTLCIQFNFFKVCKELIARDIYLSMGKDGGHMKKHTFHSWYDLFHARFTFGSEYDKIDDSEKEEVSELEKEYQKKIEEKSKDNENSQGDKNSSLLDKNSPISFQSLIMKKMKEKGENLDLKELQKIIDRKTSVSDEKNKEEEKSDEDEEEKSDKDEEGKSDDNEEEEKGKQEKGKQEETSKLW